MVKSLSDHQPAAPIDPVLNQLLPDGTQSIKTGV
jgi:hypothetical protein